MENEFITIAEAAKLTGKSDLALMRAIKEKLQNTGTSLESILKREQRGQGAMYVINKEFLLGALVETPDIPPVKEISSTNELIQAKDEMIDILQKVIETKDKQMSDLSGKIDELIERDRETNILLKGLQDRLFLLEQAKPPEQQDQVQKKDTGKK